MKEQMKNAKYCVACGGKLSNSSCTNPRCELFGKGISVQKSEDMTPPTTRLQGKQVNYGTGAVMVSYGSDAFDNQAYPVHGSLASLPPLLLNRCRNIELKEAWQTLDSLLKEPIKNRDRIREQTTKIIELANAEKSGNN
jgi:hypothetical protein